MFNNNKNNSLWNFSINTTPYNTHDNNSIDYSFIDKINKDSEIKQKKGVRR